MQKSFLPYLKNTSNHKNLSVTDEVFQKSSIIQEIIKGIDQYAV
jgi:hypothetical protein